MIYWHSAGMVSRVTGWGLVWAGLGWATQSWLERVWLCAAYAMNGGKAIIHTSGGSGDLKHGFAGAGLSGLEWV